MRNERITITVEADRDGTRKIESYLLKVVGILSVKVETGGKSPSQDFPGAGA